jgi:hypothetical protein
MPNSPFIYGRPVQPDEFLNRETELRTIFNRLRNGESTAVVGEPHIGKTSLLLKVVDRGTQRDYLGSDARELLVSPQDLHPINSSYTQSNFWEEALESLQRYPTYVVVARQLKQAVESNYSRRSLVRLFNHMGQQNLQLVLLLDEFERLLIHPNFQDPAFFALLRSLASRTGGLALVTASRLSVAEMNERGRGLLDGLQGRGLRVTGSPFFNNLVEVPLRPFGERTVAALLNRAGDVLSTDDRRFVRRVAGRHPFLLQAMAATLVETRGRDRQVHAAEDFYKRISFHFDDLWRELDTNTRTTAVILSLVELGKRALGSKFACGEIENIAAFGPMLQVLAERGLAERVGEGSKLDLERLLLWRKERWTVGTQAFAWWVRDVVIAETRQLPAYEEWLVNRRYRFLLTQEQWNWLVSTVYSAPQWVVQGVGGLARALFEELMERE